MMIWASGKKNPLAAVLPTYDYAGASLFLLPFSTKLVLVKFKTKNMKKNLHALNKIPEIICEIK